jgi:fructokinase
MRSAYGCKGPDEAYDLIRENGCSYLIYTSGSAGVFLRTPDLSKYYAIPSIRTVSNIGAGDSFNAGIAYMLHMENIRLLENVSESMWDRIIETAVWFASEVCMRNENYISWDFARNLKKQRFDRNYHTT